MVEAQFKIGDTIRSHDFDDDHSFVEGEIKSIELHPQQQYLAYVIDVDHDQFGRENPDIDKRVGSEVWVPVRTAFEEDRRTPRVILAHEAKNCPMKIECNSHHDDGRFSASWSDNDFRFHVWIKADGKIECETAIDYSRSSDSLLRDVNGGNLYKNKINNPDRYEDGHYDTRRLDISAKAHAKTLAKLTALIEATDFEQLRKDKEQAEADKEAKQKAASAENIRTAFLNWINETGFPQPGAKDLSHDQLFALTRQLRECNS